MNEFATFPPVPPDEANRLAAVERYKLGGIGREKEFDNITRFAAELFGVPISLVSIVGSDMQCFRGACGMDSSGTPRDIAFCAFAILDPDVTVVEDATLDARFARNPLVVGDPFIRFYAGAPLKLDGYAVGTLCLLDSKPRVFGEAERKQLAALARTVVDMIEFRVERFANEDSQQRLREERELLNLTVNNVTEGIALFDRRQRLMLWNRGFADLLGYPQGVLEEGARASRLIEHVAATGALGAGDPERLARELATPLRRTDSREIELSGSDGRIVRFWRKPLADGRFIATVRDVTDERQIARLKDELISTVSHELRTPLTAIGGALGLLENLAGGALPEQAGRLVHIARRNSDRLIELVNDLLDMDKLQSGRMPFRFEPQDLKELLVDAAQQNQPYAERSGVAIALDLPEGNVIASIDRTRMFQVLTNLLSNACKFSPAGSSVRLSLAVEGDANVVRVSDRGPGIGGDFRARLFTRFAQEEGAHQSGHAGTGLGLAICKAIVEAHHGTILLDESYSEGARFVVRLPRGGGAAAASSR